MRGCSMTFCRTGRCSCAVFLTPAGSRPDSWLSSTCKRAVHSRRRSLFIRGRSDQLHFLRKVPTTMPGGHHFFVANEGLSRQDSGATNHLNLARRAHRECSNPSPTVAVHRPWHGLFSPPPFVLEALRRPVRPAVRQRPATHRHV